MKNIIVAYDLNRAIGFNNALPWQGQLPADMQYFRNTTRDSALIMGRKTFESIGRPLPGRLNIVLSRHTLHMSGVSVVSSLDEAYEIASNRGETFVIGGAEIYRMALQSTERVFATEIKTISEAADTFFPGLDPSKWHEISRDSHSADSKNVYPYNFVVYGRLNKNS